MHTQLKLPHNLIKVVRFKLFQLTRFTTTTNKTATLKTVKKKLHNVKSCLSSTSSGKWKYLTPKNRRNLFNFKGSNNKSHRPTQKAESGRKKWSETTTKSYTHTHNLQYTWRAKLKTWNKLHFHCHLAVSHTRILPPPSCFVLLACTLSWAFWHVISRFFCSFGK